MSFILGLLSENNDISPNITHLLILAMKPQHNVLEVLTAVMKIEICSEVWLCRQVNSHRHVKGSHCLHLQLKTVQDEGNTPCFAVRLDMTFYMIHEFHTSEDAILRKLLPISPSGWAPESVRTLSRRGKFLSPGGNGNSYLRSPSLQLLQSPTGDKVIIFRTGKARLTTDTILRCHGYLSSCLQKQQRTI
jgi:hypothetical protein